jgi:peptidoglycan hydrolase CwlO-like protein
MVLHKFTTPRAVVQAVITCLLIVTFGFTAHTTIAQDCEQISCNKDNESDYIKCISEKRSCLEKKITEVQSQKITLTSTLNLLNSKIVVQELQINQIEAEINKLEREIGSLSERITGLNVTLDRMSTMLVERIREQYKQSRVSPFTLLVAADSFDEFQSRMEYLAQASGQTATGMQRAELARIVYDQEKELKEKKQSQVEKKRISLQSEQNVLTGQRKEQQFLLTETNNNEQKYQAELAKTLAELNAIQSIIAGKGAESKVGDVKQGDKIASIIQGASTCSNGTHLHFEVVKDGVNRDPAAYLKSITITWNNQPDSSFGLGGDWDWPLNDPARITQGYGMTYYARVRRAYGGSPHTGIDMVSKSSDYTVKAVKDGVAYRGSIKCGSGQLRYVKVQHKDDGYSTYYLHVNY